MNKEQFISIVRENQNLIYKICFSYCQDAESRKDLQQEILIQLWKSFETYDGRVKISTWIYRVALNTAISFYRRESKFKKKETTLNDEIIHLPDNYENSQQENISLLYGFIDEMNELDRAIILLYLDDNKYQDIADILGITETNVATKISRIKKKLKEKFNNAKN